MKISSIMVPYVNIFSWNGRFFLTYGIVYSNFCPSEIIFKVRLLSFTTFNYYSICERNLNKLSIKYQSYPKSRIIDAFEQNIWMRHKL